MDIEYNKNQRRFPRRPAYIIAEYSVREGNFRDIIKNIGASGLYVSTWRKITSGQPIVMHFPIFDFDQIFRVEGRVVRSSRQGFAVTFDEPIEGLICEEGQFPKIVHESER